MGKIKITMADYLPFDIQAEIMKKLSIKSLIRIRSVSKQWKSLIDSSDFIANYHVNNTMSKHHLLIMYDDSDKRRYVSFVDDSDKRRYVSFVDDDTFPRDMFSHTLPWSVELLKNQTIAGSSQGLLCFYTYYREERDTGKKIKAVIWNPTIRKSVTIDLPNVYEYPYVTIVGFGVCPGTSDPKLVKITTIGMCQCQSCSCLFDVEVFTLSSRVWRRISVALTRKTITLTKSSVAVDGFTYWLAYERVDRADTEYQWNKLILSFDMTSEKFTEIDIPDSLAFDSHIGCSISKLKESLVVLEYNNKDKNRSVYSVWMMENNVSKSFTKLFTINTPNASIEKVLGFRKSGEPIIGLDNGYNEDVFVYESNSKRKSSIGISGNLYSFSGNSYMETLLLIDH